MDTECDRIENVKPDDVGLVDEGWYIGRRLADGKWLCWSDAGEPGADAPVILDSELEARAYWREAEEAVRPIR